MSGVGGKSWSEYWCVCALSSSGNGQDVQIYTRGGPSHGGVGGTVGDCRGGRFKLSRGFIFAELFARWAQPG